MVDIVTTLPSSTLCRPIDPYDKPGDCGQYPVYLMQKPGSQHWGLCILRDLEITLMSVLSQSRIYEPMRTTSVLAVTTLVPASNGRHGDNVLKKGGLVE